jgi:hypothetical protein
LKLLKSSWRYNQACFNRLLMIEVTKEGLTILLWNQLLINEVPQFLESCLKMKMWSKTWKLGITSLIKICNWYKILRKKCKKIELWTCINEEVKFLIKLGSTAKKKNRSFQKLHKALSRQTSSHQKSLLLLKKIISHHWIKD